MQNLVRSKTIGVTGKVEGVQQEPVLVATLFTAYIQKHATAKAERWMSWPTDTERTLKLRTTSLQEHANQVRGMHRPQEGQGPAYSRFQHRNAPPLALKPAAEQPQPKPRPRPGGADTWARRAKRPKPETKPAPAPPPPDPQPKQRPQACPFFTPAEHAAMHPEWPDGADIQGGLGATLRGQPKQFVWFRGKIQGRLATPGQHGNLQLKIKRHALPEWGEKSGDLKPRTLGQQAVPGVLGAALHTRQPGDAGHRMDR